MSLACMLALDPDITTTINIGNFYVGIENEFGSFSCDLSAQLTCWSNNQNFWFDGPVALHVCRYRFHT